MVQISCEGDMTPHEAHALRAYDYKTIIVTVIARARTTTGVRCPVLLSSRQQRLFVVFLAGKTTVSENENSFSFSHAKRKAATATLRLLSQARRAKLMTSFIHSVVLFSRGFGVKRL